MSQSNFFDRATNTIHRIFMVDVDLMLISTAAQVTATVVILMLKQIQAETIMRQWASSVQLYSSQYDT